MARNPRAARPPRRNGRRPALRKRMPARRRRNVGRPLMQGAAALPRVAFGSTRRLGYRAWDATCPSHLPLPRATGPYTVVRTTKLVPFNSLFGFTASFADMGAAGIGALEHPRWANIAWVQSAGIGSISAVNNASRFAYRGIDQLGLGCSLVPAALTVQVMCPEPLQTAEGIVYIGRSHAQYDLSGSARTWTDMGNDFVAYMAPRVCSAAKLALRGVKVSSYPLDMSALADFRTSDLLTEGVFTWDSAQRMGPEGLAPIVIYNPNQVTLQLLVTCEWRVRFDASNPAAASHRTYTPTTDKVWADLSSVAHRMGHGAVDIVEDIAEAGAEGAAFTAAVAAM